MSTPYCYLIGWSGHKKYYYGVRWARGYDPSDLMVRYFTSSKLVHKMIKRHGHPDVIDVRKVFATKEEAIRHEHTVLRRLKVIHREDFLNQTDNKSIVMSEEVSKQRIEAVKIRYEAMSSEERRLKYGRRWTDEERVARSASQKGKRWWTNGITSVKSFESPGTGWVQGRHSTITDEGRQKLSEKGKNRQYPGRTQTDESNRKRSEKLKGRAVSAETRKKHSEASKGRKLTPEHIEKMRAIWSDGRRKGELNPSYGSTHMRGRKHYNNGIVGVMAYECPPGFTPGRLKQEIKPLLPSAQQD